jgi:hypothetical protein
MGMTRSDQCRRWTRRAGFKIAEPLANGYRFGERFKFFQNRLPCAAEASPNRSRREAREREARATRKLRHSGCAFWRRRGIHNPRGHVLQ